MNEKRTLGYKNAQKTRQHMDRLSERRYAPQSIPSNLQILETQQNGSPKDGWKDGSSSQKA
ncbi:hypothetical protein HAX54_041502, partial [Datura stramonium]|nr:hypothetical protein [Datura stramonium]